MITLKDLLENTKAQNIKVGANSMFLYCGENNEQAKEQLSKYLDREVIYAINGVAYDEPNTLVIKFVGTENGRYCTIKEFQRAKAKIKIRKFKKVLTSLRAKLKNIHGRKEQANVQRATIKQEINGIVEQIDTLKVASAR